MIAETQHDATVDLEAWKLVLSGAESHVEDAIDEDGQFDEATYDQILDRAMDIIKELRAEHLS